MKYTFSKKADSADGLEVTFTFDAVTRDGMVANFELFLRACEYHFDGALDFVEPKQDPVPFKRDWGYQEGVENN